MINQMKPVNDDVYIGKMIKWESIFESQYDIKVKQLCDEQDLYLILKTVDKSNCLNF